MHRNDHARGPDSKTFNSADRTDVLSAKESAAEFKLAPGIGEPIERKQVGGDGRAPDVRDAGMEPGCDFDTPPVLGAMIELEAAFNAWPGSLRGQRGLLVGRKLGGLH